MHALIIEDQVLVAMMIEDQLRELGFTSFDVVDTEQEAIAAAERQCPVLITADDRLTTGSGVEAVKIICAEQVIPTIYIVGNPHDLDGALPHAVVLEKPFRIDELEDAVQRAARAVPVTNETADNS